MDSMHSTDRTGLATRRIATAALIVVGLALAVSGQARPGHGHHRFGSGDWIEKHAEELGIDDTTLAEIDAIVEASRGQAEAIYEEHRAARDAMRDLLEQDEPDVSAVMRQAEVIGEIDVRKHKHRLETMLAIRAKLTPDQRAQLRELKDEMREKRGKHRHRHHEGCDGESCKHGKHHGDDAPPEEEL